jgi:hypothetical protein
MHVIERVGLQETSKMLSLFHRHKFKSESQEVSQVPKVAQFSQRFQLCDYLFDGVYTPSVLVNRKEPP